MPTEPALDLVIKLLSWNPARRFTVRAAESPSGQGDTPFEGQEPTGRVEATFLRAQLVYERGAITGPPRGRVVRRPMPRVPAP